MRRSNEVVRRKYQNIITARSVPAKLSDEEIKTLEKLPQVLAIQKKKFLMAINENKDAAIPTVTEEDERVVKDVTDSLVKQVYGIRIYCTDVSSKQWHESAIHLRNTLEMMLQEHAIFDLNKYLDCAEFACYIFAAKQNPYHSDHRCRIDYLLTHARQFGDPTKTIFQLEGSVNKKFPALPVIIKTTMLTSKGSTIVERTKQLIAELREEYDENKYRALNAQTTSFVFILLRRLMKNLKSTSEISSNFQNLYLIIEAYLTTNDPKTKKNIRETCTKYMEWYDMQLPCLFFKVVELYSIEASELWDLLCSIKSRKTNISMIYLASEYYNKYEMLKANSTETQEWFPYCRLLDKDCHKRLSNKVNVCICAILGSLIEMKNTLDEPAFKYSCPDNDNVNEWAMKIAADLFSKIKK